MAASWQALSGGVNDWGAADQAVGLIAGPLRDLLTQHWRMVNIQ